MPTKEEFDKRAQQLFDKRQADGIAAAERNRERLRRELKDLDSKYAEDCAALIAEFEPYLGKKP